MCELRGTSITVSCVYPGGVSSGIASRTQHGTDDDAANFDRRALTTPEQAARTILRGIKADKEVIIVGLDARIASMATRMAPRGTRRAIAWGLETDVCADHPHETGLTTPTAAEAHSDVQSTSCAADSGELPGPVSRISLMRRRC